MDGCLSVCMDGWMFVCMYMHICMYVCTYVWTHPLEAKLMMAPRDTKTGFISEIGEAVAKLPVCMYVCMYICMYVCR